MPEAFWSGFLDSEDESVIRAQKSEYYFSLIRNFHRHSWLGCYLFGASPAVCKSFLQGREHVLEDFDPVSFYAPSATSLRLSRLGYNSDAQADIEIGYNTWRISSPRCVWRYSHRMRNTRNSESRLARCTGN